MRFRHRVSLLGALALSAAFTASARAQLGGGGGVNLAGVGHDKGARTSPVFIVEFGDFGCSYCAKFAAETYGRIDSAYIAKGQVRWKMVPYVTGMFRNSREVTEAAECAAEQGKFWPMHDLLFQRRREWMASGNVRALITRWGAELQLDASAFARCAMNPNIAERIRRNDAFAARLGIRGTPTFFVNGRVIPGAIPWELFRQVIDEASR
jgi:protein-disulfide isomerase